MVKKHPAGNDVRGIKLRQLKKKTCQFVKNDLEEEAMDRWPSGLRRTIGNRVYLQRVP